MHKSSCFLFLGPTIYSRSDMCKLPCLIHKIAIHVRSCRCWVWLFVYLGNWWLWRRTSKCGPLCCCRLSRRDRIHFHPKKPQDPGFHIRNWSRSEVPPCLLWDWCHWRVGIQSTVSGNTSPSHYLQMCTVLCSIRSTPSHQHHFHSFFPLNTPAAALSSKSVWDPCK